MSKIDSTLEAKLNSFYEHSALTFEGVAPSKENEQDVEKWLTEKQARTENELILHWIKGHTMNEFYGLRGDNAYPNDLTILVVDPTSIDLTKVIMARFELGGRWFDDVVNNNRHRKG